MNGIMGFSHLLAEPTVEDDKRLEFAGIVVVNDILDLSQLDSGNLIINKTSVKLNTFLDSLFLFFKDQVELKSQYFRIEREKEDEDIFVIIDKETSVVIALYQRNKKADKKDYKAMVGGLMAQFGEPTTMAHEKSIYWNYTEDGLISEDLYRTVKEQGKLETLAVLATVKFSSTQSLEELSSDKKEKKDEKVFVASDNYVMIQSDVLSKKYMGK